MKRSWFVHFLTALIVGFGVLPAAFAVGMEKDDLPQWDFVVGRYQLIGRAPDSQRTYHGKARIERVGGKLKLTRVIDGKSSQALGVVRRADPGEAWVLAFAWKEKRAMEMVCVIGTDLDNYARLSCHWGRAGNPHRQPGMEAYFAQEPWDPLPR